MSSTSGKERGENISNFFPFPHLMGLEAWPLPTRINLGLVTVQMLPEGRPEQQTLRWNLCLLEGLWWPLLKWYCLPHYLTMKGAARLLGSLEDEVRWKQLKSTEDRSVPELLQCISHEVGLHFCLIITLQQDHKPGTIHPPVHPRRGFEWSTGSWPLNLEGSESNIQLGNSIRGLHSCEVSNAMGQQQDRRRRHPFKLAVLMHPCWREWKKHHEVLRLEVQLGEEIFLSRSFWSVPSWQQDRGSSLHKKRDFTNVFHPLYWISSPLKVSRWLCSWIQAIILVMWAAWCLSCRSFTTSPHHRPEPEIRKAICGPMEKVPWS